ncbi:MAG TPA: pitrilysin family protein [Thermogutta sp.]|nr:pitrilysin family protein [Thermogutta sp.]
MRFYSHILPNGLEVIAECSPSAFSTALGFFVRVGARDEPEDISGVSHFLEHMAFKGSGSRTADDINREFDEIGAVYNAMTSYDSTIYYAAVLPEYMEKAFELLACLIRPAIRPDDFELEKKVILEEIRMYLDQPPYGIDETCRRRFFKTHPLGQSVLGTVESISALTPEQMRMYYQQRYTARNIIVGTTGCVDFDKLVALAERYCGDLNSEENERIQLRPDPAFGTFRHHKPSATQQYVIQIAEAPPATSPERFAGRFLTAIVGSSTASRMYWEFLDPGRADSVSLTYESYEDAGIFVTFLSCAPEMLEENLERLRKLYNQLETEGVSAEELSRVKNKMAASLVLAAERPSSRLFAIGSERLTTGEYRSVEEELKIIDSITLDDVNRVAEKYPLSCNATEIIGPMPQGSS